MLGARKLPSSIAPKPSISAPSKVASAAVSKPRGRDHKPVKIDKLDWDVSIVFDKIEKGEINLEPE